jgi:hypothetical protein
MSLNNLIYNIKSTQPFNPQIIRADNYLLSKKSYTNKIESGTPSDQTGLTGPLQQFYGIGGVNATVGINLDTFQSASMANNGRYNGNNPATQILAVDNGEFSSDLVFKTSNPSTNASILNVAEERMIIYADGDVNILNNLVINENLAIKKDFVVQGDIAIAGDAYLYNDLYVQNNEIINGDLGVTETSTFGGTGQFNNNVNINGNLGVTGTSTFGGTGQFNNNVNINGNLGVTGTSTFGGTGHFNNNVNINGNLGVTGTSTFGGTGQFNNNVNINSDLIMGGTGIQLPNNYTALNSSRYLGYIGTDQNASSVSLTDSIPTNLSTILLNSGVYIITGLSHLNVLTTYSSALTLIQCTISISEVSATISNQSSAIYFGSSGIVLPTAVGNADSAQQLTVTHPFKITSDNTTIYLVGSIKTSGGSGGTFGSPTGKSILTAIRIA